MQKEVAPVL